MKGLSADSPPGRAAHVNGTAPYQTLIQPAAQRIVQQFLTESILLVAMAAVAALLMAGWARDVLMRLVTVTADGGPPLTAPLDVYVLAFAAGAAFLSVLTFGV